jgi:putative glycosyltransferase
MGCIKAARPDIGFRNAKADARLANEDCYVKLSIVTTLYRSAPTIEEFYRRIMTAAATVTNDIELIVVNDGSPDESLALALAMHERDPRIVVVDLARNFGHHKAMMTGLSYAHGDLVFLIDSDLEEEPELIIRFYQRLVTEDCDVVYGVQQTRRGNLLDRTVGELFFWLSGALSDQPIPRNLVTARLMTSDYVQALTRHRDREFMIAHLWQLSGFRQIPIEIKKLSLSPSSYSLNRRIEMAIKYVTTTSTKLLYMVLYTGIFIFGLSIAVILYYLARYFTTGIGVDGFTSLIVSVWFFGGLITLILGVLGIYLANILSETKRRPYTVVRRVHRTETVMAAMPKAVPDPATEERHDQRAYR